LKGEGDRSICYGFGVDRETACRHISGAIEFGIDRLCGEQHRTDELIGRMVERVRPYGPDGYGEVWRVLPVAQENQITRRMDEGERTHCRQDRDTAASRPDRGPAPWHLGAFSRRALWCWHTEDDGADGQLAVWYRDPTWDSGIDAASGGIKLF